MSSLSTKKDIDLRKELALKKGALRGFRFGVAGSKVKNIKEARNLRKDVARILTELSSRKQKIN